MAEEDIAQYLEHSKEYKGEVKDFNSQLLMVEEASENKEASRVVSIQ